MNAPPIIRMIPQIIGTVRERRNAQNGCPHFGQVIAAVETSVLQSGQAWSGIERFNDLVLLVTKLPFGNATIRETPFRRSKK